MVSITLKKTVYLSSWDAHLSDDEWELLKATIEAEYSYSVYRGEMQVDSMSLFMNDSEIDENTILSFPIYDETNNWKETSIKEIVGIFDERSYEDAQIKGYEDGEIFD